jgi:sugar/nucleoside kinase (ribokinase family)
MGEGRRIALVGTINRDTIRTADGVETESYGGLLYSILALAEIVTPGTRIYPIVNVGADMRAVVENMLAGYSSVRHDGIRIVPEKNTHCYLQYDDQGRKQETLLGGVPELTIDQIAPFLNVDAICFNFITGMELSLPVLQEVRRRASGRILMDLHSLTLGIDEARRRFWRVPPQWEAWTACADVVQMNEQEAALLHGAPLDGEADTRRFGEAVLRRGSKVVLVTRNRLGADAIFTNGTGAVEVHRSPPVPAGPARDETGCGDTFLMGFTWSLLKDGDPIAASRFAKTVAGINVTVRGIDGVRQIGRLLSGRAG